MKIAVIGGGVSGLVAARLLSTCHDVQLFEAGETAGGHANTVEVIVQGNHFALDTGFMVFNDRTYPLFTRMLDLLEIQAQSSDMSFSVSCERTGLEYQGSSLDGLFAQRKNAFRPKFYRMLLEIVRFNRLARAYLATQDQQLTLGEFLIRNRFVVELRDHYLLPMTAAIWSCPAKQVLDFPARFLLQFMDNHGLIQLQNRPKWLTIPGGSRRYVHALMRGLGNRVHVKCPVKHVTRQHDGVTLEFNNQASRKFDTAVFATHADTSLQLLSDADGVERTLLSAFPYQTNEAVLHTDESWLPQSKAAWASWNYRIAASEEKRVCVTYDLTRLQRIDSPQRLLVTLNPPRAIDPSHILRKFLYQHPVFSADAIAAQSWWNEINGPRRTYFCGAYWRHGFHEDGVASALAVTEKFGIGLEACTAPCITEKLLMPVGAQ